MFEPLSAVAVLGFAIGTLGFLVSTISKVDEKVQDIRECEIRLRSFNWQLTEAQLKLIAWRWIWMGKEAFATETYLLFRGTGGLEEVQSRVKGIMDLSNEIKNLLRHPVVDETRQPLPRSELNEWHHLINHDLAELHSWRHVTSTRANLVRKVSFTLFRNTTLLEKIGRLRSHVEGLQDFTQYTFRLRQQSDPTSRVAPSELHRISDLKAFVDRISDFGSRLHASRLTSPRLEWRLELGPPEAGQALDEWSEVDTTCIDFIVRDTAPDVQTRSSRVRICVDKQLAHPARTLAKTIERVDEAVLTGGRFEYHCEYDRFFRILEKPSRRSRPLRKMLAEGVFSGKHRKSFDVECADLVYGLGHWMVLLWNTPWSYDLCTCGIRCTHLENTRTRHSLLPYQKISHWYLECHPSNLAENRLELLGVALAEVALALPICVMLIHEERRYIVNKEPMTRKQLLGTLREKFGRNTITKAVSYCLDPASTNLGDLLRPDHLEMYCQNIVLP